MSNYSNDAQNGTEPEHNEGVISDSAITTVEQQTYVYKSIDKMMLPVLLIFLGSVTIFLVSLTIGDWDYWQDWRDRRWWPLVTPFSYITTPAVFTYFLWKYFRLPIAATCVAIGYMAGVYVSRYVNFHEFAGFPFAFVAPSTFIGMCIILDCVMLITRSFFFTGAIGAFLFALVCYPLNWPAFAPFHVPVEYHGVMVTVADLMGFQYIRTAMPEYVRIIEESTLRTFGEAVTPLTAFFAGFVTLLHFYLWVWIGSMFSKSRWLKSLV